MSKTEIGEVYQSYGDSYDFEQFPDAKRIADIDESEDYATDRTAIYADADGTFILATASGCSCWGGEWQLVRYDSVEELLTDIGPHGESDYLYNPSFEGVKDLARQVADWQATPAWATPA